MKKTVILFVLFSLIFILPARADINSDLIRAARDGHTAIVKTLLEKGADANVKGKKGEMAFRIAAGKGYTEIMQALLENGADVNTKDENGGTALMLVAWPYHNSGVLTG